MFKNQFTPKKCFKINTTSIQKRHESRNIEETINVVFDADTRKTF